MTEFRIGGCLVSIDEDERRVTTMFPDGTELVATPSYDDESFARAAELGYSTLPVCDNPDCEACREHQVWGMTRDHDLMHTVLAEARGQDRSPTLYSVVSDGEYADWRDEESIVLLMQRLNNIGLARMLRREE